ncbi:hypothetical protein QSV34_03540 [Porticoccus sp. W117]|uniref:hypothetical protein n=1 Tax=Porticoccus sp. W117 TaxID=3054777 RepID=UPI002599AE69|nr:hypothetical protein [Porticoccus sp. W117]MDM3870424.1 hypothetical protein [Porticoccus sp. W117]
MGKPLVLILAAALCSGCAYNNAINRGDQQFSGGNYERAVEAYQQALIKKPESVKAQQKLAIAQQNLAIWSDQINAAANSADKRNLSALAAALHQKQAQLNGDKTAGTRAAQLRRQLSIRYTPLLFVQGNPRLLSNITAPSQPFRAGQSNHLSLRVTASKPNFSTEEFDATGSHEYISGTITRSNPDYLNLQDELQILSHKIGQLQDKQHYLHQDIASKERQLAKHKGALEEQRRNLQTATPDTPQYNAIQQRIKELKQAVRHSKQQLASLREDYDHIHRKIDARNQDYHHLEDDLVATPTEVIEDVYATYEYPMVEVVQTATLTLNFSQGEQRDSADVLYRYNDQVYSGNPRADLSENPREPLSRPEMRESLMENAAQRVAEQAALVAADYRQALLDDAMQQPDQQGKLDKLIRYALSSDQPPEPHIRQLTNRLLRAEFGNGGTLDIQQLLKY